MPDDSRGNERPSVEDPLVELARIVNRNKQSGAHVSGRVENTDYFAALDDVAAEPQVRPDAEQGRIEPSFGDAATPRAHSDSGAEAGFYQEAAGAVPSEPEKIHGLTIPAAGEMSMDGQADVSALWPQQPDVRVSGEPEVSQASVHAEHEPVNPADPYQGYQYDTASPEASEVDERTGLAPSVSLHLEQNLTAELEDELIGALRQSVDETATATAPEAHFEEPGYRSEDLTAYAVHPETGYREPELGVGVETGQSDETDHVDQWSAAPAVGHAVGAFPSDPVAGMGEALREASAFSEGRQSEGAAEPEPVAPVRRPAINENDLFAALNDTHAEADGAPSVRAGAEGENPAGIDSLFADLDFPDPANRKSAAVVGEANSATASVSAAEIDDLTWPAAVEAVPQTEEEETPPPPEGYDLDAVARAMQESDPSLAGAGVLPPHTAAEKAAMPHAREKSRRSLFVAGGVLGIAVIGAVGFFMMDGDAIQVPSGPPPVISGLQEPLKIYPEKVAAADGNQSGKLIYDRVDGSGSSGPDRLVLPESPEPAELPPAPVGVNGSADLVPGSPKRVRTLVVRPDGTIISEGDPVASPSTTPAIQAPSSVAGTDSPRVVATSPIISSDQPAATPEAIADPQNGAAVPLQAAPATPAIVAGTETETPAGPVPTVLPRKKPNAPVQVAQAPQAVAAPAPAAPQDGPLNLGQQASVPAAAAPAPAAPSAPASASGASGSIPSGTYIVQVTSQRTAAAASDAYSSLQRRFPAILGNRQAVVVTADLGDRGVFYRARIPTGSRDDANALCESLQAAGGDCFVRRQP
ncbi:SPOR domain-containing protein [Labrenzia sp. 011]|uniref:SPOR domain-containing protein n=1 Tax=Labrenzia sp. 011 TaxID=2171494 RepID=UPI001404128E|nr:SPOR domain-containing protein [Labrenzia sp. 011]